jgi:4-amino-4-deoxy-L-arabinose transferase-like glycosyltransferase
MTSNEGVKRGSFLAAATGILIAAALFRLVALQDVPPGLAQDEVLNADITGFILDGRHALFFREGYGHEPLFHYWTVPFRVLLGDNFLAIRLPAVYLGLLLVAATMRWARRDFGELAALVAGAGLAISWWPIIFSRIGIRPILEPLLLVLAVWFWRRRPVIGGLLLGAAIYSYTAARYVFLLPLVFAAYLVAVRPRERERFGRWQAAITVFLVSFAMYVPLALTLRADPTLQQRVDQLAGPIEALRTGDLGPVWEATRATLGIFSFGGDPRWTYTLPGHPLFDPLSALPFYGGLIIVLVRIRRPRYSLVAFWLAFALMPSALTPEAPSTVRLVGAIPVVYLLPGIAFAQLWHARTAVQGRWRRWVGWAIGAVGVLLLVANASRTIADGFGVWPRAMETRVKYQSVLLDVARHWEQQKGTSALVVADAFFEPIDADSLRRNLGEPLPARWVQAGQGVAGAIVWTGKTTLLYVPEYAPLAPELMDAAGIAETPWYRSQSVPGFAVYEIAAAPPQPDYPVVVSFEAQIAFTGYSLAASGEGTETLFTFWQVHEAPLPADLAIFVHLLGGNGNIVAQHDGLDAAPALLRRGDVVVQRHPLPAFTGYTEIRLGLYRRGDGKRFLHGGSPPDVVRIRNAVLGTEDG